MRYLYLSVQLFPFWSLPLALIVFEMAWHFKRTGKTKAMFGLFVVVLAIVTINGCWIYSRGDIHSQDWVRKMRQ